jgi:hypothetical protein
MEKKNYLLYPSDQSYLPWKTANPTQNCLSLG